MGSSGYWSVRRPDAAERQLLTAAATRICCCTPSKMLNGAQEARAKKKKITEYGCGRTAGPALEVRDARWDSSESLGSPCSLCSQCLEHSVAEEWDGRDWKVNCHSKRKPFSHLGRAVTERRGVW